MAHQRAKSAHPRAHDGRCQHTYHHCTRESRRDKPWRAYPAHTYAMTRHRRAYDRDHERPQPRNTARNKPRENARLNGPCPPRRQQACQEKTANHCNRQHDAHHRHTLEWTKSGPQGTDSPPNDQESIEKIENNPDSAKDAAPEER
jgi:hypothetical protein